MHHDFNSTPSRKPFNRYPVVAYRIESGTESDERFRVWEIDLPNDDLGPRKLPSSRSEAQARTRLVELGLTESEIDARIARAREWMTTRILPPGADPAMWRPPLQSPQTIEEILLVLKR